MTAPTLESVQAYYDERVEGKLRDFTDANPRIEAAIQLLAEWAPPQLSRTLEIGCGIGATCWRMARAWPEAEVIGVDVSPLSIKVAKTCFQLPNLSYCAGLIQQGTLGGKFDVVLLMDTYEHIALGDRAALHTAIKSFLSNESRLIMTFPTPAVLSHTRTTKPCELQPVDEDVTSFDVVALAQETNTQLLYYRKVGIWQYGDYAHVVLGRCQMLAPVKLRQDRPKGIAALKRRVKRLFALDQTQSTGRQDYFGSDVLRPSPRRVSDQFKVGASERQQLASLWVRTSGAKPSSGGPQADAGPDNRT